MTFTAKEIENMTTTMHSRA